ncbi:hypothetical protein QBC45DRAFT_384236 [Copromyces sp. CBS 386.78]|nr:hypothetical protein QBC45DRAFT_384236 [Copromyces sp. CBS 386.78]
MVNRGMNTPLRLPNGTVTFPSSDIPPMRTHQVELGHETRFTEIVCASDDLLKDIYTELPKHELNDLNLPKTTDEERKIALNLTFIRLLQFLSFTTMVENARRKLGSLGPCDHWSLSVWWLRCFKL